MRQIGVPDGQRWDSWKEVNHTHRWKLGLFHRRPGVLIKAFTEIPKWLMNNPTPISPSSQKHGLRVDRQMLFSKQMGKILLASNCVTVSLTGQAFIASDPYAF